MIPRRRRPEKLGLKDRPQIRCPQHLQYVRGHYCSVQNDECRGKIVAAHVRQGTDGNLGTKPSDKWTIPLCWGHHEEQGRLYERPFEQKYGISMRAIAEALWKRSPAGIRWRREHEDV